MPETNQKPVRDHLSSFEVGTGTQLLSGIFTRFPRWWHRVSSWETRLLQSELASIEIDRPVYVCGLARSGTTLLLEILAGHEEVATHQYRDFPALFVPYWWNQSQRWQPRELPTERAHGDRLQVTSRSPEAMEEVLWMSCFNHLHDPQQNQILDAEIDHPVFEKLYREHLQKLLLVRDGRRYVAKGNYNLTRLGYLQHLFSDAKFVVPVRQPIGHVASLIKQHRLFCEAGRVHPRSRTHLQRVGHFEFGLDVQLINVGDTAQVESIYELWDQGESVRGWARYWAMIHQWLVDYLNDNDDVQRATQLVRYEELCQQPATVLKKLLRFTQLEDDSLVERWQNEISAPDYYQHGFTDKELGIIETETSSIAKQLEVLGT